MPSVKSSVLILGLTPQIQLQVGADFYPDWIAKKSLLSEANYDLICASLQILEKKEFENLFRRLKENNPTLQMILLADQSDSALDLQKALARYPIFRISDANDVNLFEKDIVYGLEEAQMAQQTVELENLVREQNEKLKQLYADLEERVEKRQNFLLETRRKTYIANARWESLHDAMIAIYQSTSAGDMETNLLGALQPTLQLDSIRILFKPQDQFFSQQKKAQQNFSSFQVSLFRSQDNIGSIFFQRQRTLPFQREETDFLIRVAEAVSLAMDRQSKLEQSETLKEQWQATFNAVSDPVALVNQRYELVQTNSAFQKKSGLSFEQVIGQKCHQILFQKDSPCPHCQLGKKFRLEFGKPKTIYDVYSQPVPVEPLRTTVYVNLYHDVTEQSRMERKILESARLAEIGTIGSSIAHELNNPLGGILSFVQLIKMDLKPEGPIYEDICSMEEGVRRCKEIIQNLLGFTRDPVVDEERELDLREVIDRALKIVELQTKSRGIDVRVDLPAGPLPFVAHLNLLSQAVRNLLQYSIDSLIEKLLSQKNFHGFIEVRIEMRANEYVIKFLDNGLGSESTSSLSLSVAGQIIHDYNGQLEFSSQSKPFRLAQVLLPRPVFQA